MVEPATGADPVHHAELPAATAAEAPVNDPGKPPHG